MTGENEKMNMPREEIEDYWTADPDYPLGDWQYAVSNDDTRLGYWEWRDHQKAKHDRETGNEMEPIYRAQDAAHEAAYGDREDD